jgi:Kef-type K+ transport system membrane component KefB/nucleotide-binding universal stress UspA family protein
MTDALNLPLTQPAYVLVVLFATILLAPIVAERLRIPGVIGLIVAGLLLGPDGLGLLRLDGMIELLGGGGLLYLMFLAGLDLDTERFNEERRAAISFAATTTIIPMALNTGVAMLLGMPFLGAVLVASAFTSHTLLTYPMVQRFGLAASRSVTVTLGATLVATIVALLILAVVAAAHQGDVGALFWIRFTVAVALFFGLTMWGLPQLTRWIFTGVGQDRAVRFMFVLAAVFGVSVLADMAGIEAIVGAFMAGLALKRFIEGDTLLRERVQFLGSSLLIPIFLLSTGMLVDPLLLVNEPMVLLAGVALSASALLAKFLAVVPVTSLLRFARPEAGVMFGLTSAQAAGALAAAIVGVNVGLLDESDVNAVILVLLVTCVVAPAITARFAPQVHRPDRKTPRVGHRVVVPVLATNGIEPLMRVASLLAAPDSGEVLALRVLNFDASPAEVEERRDEITGKGEPVVLANGADLRTMVRVDVTPSAGMLHTIVENNATSVLMGWKGYASRRESFFSEAIDAMLTLSPVPVLVARPAGGDIRRVVLSITPSDLTPAGLPGLELAILVASRIAGQADIPLLVVTRRASTLVDKLLDDVRARVIVDDRVSRKALTEISDTGDLVVIGLQPVRAGLGRRAPTLARALPDRSLLVVGAR